MVKNIKPLYKYVRPDGGVTVSVNKPDCEYVELFRLIADEGMVVTKDGEKWYPVLDVTPEEVDEYYEVVKPEQIKASTMSLRKRA